MLEGSITSRVVATLHPVVSTRCTLCGRGIRPPCASPRADPVLARGGSPGSCNKARHFGLHSTLVPICLVQALHYAPGFTPSRLAQDRGHPFLRNQVVPNRERPRTASRKTNARTSNRLQPKTYTQHVANYGSSSTAATEPEAPGRCSHPHRERKLKTISQ